MMKNVPCKLKFKNEPDFSSYFVCSLAVVFKTKSDLNFDVEYQTIKCDLKSFNVTCNGKCHNETFAESRWVEETCQPHCNFEFENFLYSLEIKGRS